MTLAQALTLLGMLTDTVMAQQAQIEALQTQVKSLQDPDG